MAGMVDNGVSQNCDAMLSLRLWPFSTLRFFWQREDYISRRTQACWGSVGRSEARHGLRVVVVTLFVVPGRALMAAYPRVDLGFLCLSSELNPHHHCC